jgi:hypothetical protein
VSQKSTLTEQGEAKEPKKKARKGQRSKSKNSPISCIAQITSSDPLNNNMNIESLVKKVSNLSLENDKFGRLQNLSSDHIFCMEDFNACFMGRNIYNSRNMTKKLKARIERGQVWLKIKEDRPMSACLNPNLPIHEAFNTLSNVQLENGVELQREKLNCH